MGREFGEIEPPLSLLSGLERWAARWAQLSTGLVEARTRGRRGRARLGDRGPPTSVAMDAAARAGWQRRVGLRLAVEVEPHGQHHARAAVTEDDLGRLASVH